jgi:sigma54-dependent transcription regulator
LCNCEIQFSTGDVYVIYHGEERTYEFWRGRYDFTVYCGNGAYDNNLCWLEEETREYSVEIDCGDSHYINTKF